MRYTLSFLIVLFLIGSAFAQNDMKYNLFGEYESLLDELQENDAEVLSPNYFKKAVEYYKEASADYDKDKSLIDIKETLEKCRKEALKAKAVVKLAQDTLKQVLAARDDALTANAPTFAPEEWDRAEEEFQNATEELEDDDIESAREYGQEAQKLFKEAELLAIKNSVLGDARIQVSVAEREDADEYCPQTFRHAKALLMDAESFIEKNPYDRQDAAQKALMAAYEARHAQYLAGVIKSLKDGNADWEDQFLTFEEKIKNLCVPFHYEPKFDKGFDEPIRVLMSYITNMKSEEKRLIAENEKLEEELSALQESLESKSEALKEREAREEKIKKVREIFSPDEAEVVYQGDKLILRLVGLKFRSGSAVIQPEYFSLLTKVQRAIRLFPGDYVQINGHTDATGNAIKNKILSEKRAQAVAEFLLASMEMDKDLISYYGYGDLKPIASNKTREGRMKNRRIEVVISIGK